MMKRLLRFWKLSSKQKIGNFPLLVLIILATVVLFTTCQVKVDSILGNFVLPGSQPEVAVSQDETALSHDGVSFDFGLTTVTKVFTITNAGGQDLSIYSAFLIQTGSEFSIDTSSLGDTVIADGTTTFSITYTPSSTARVTAQATIVSNALEEEQFVVNILGGGTTLDFSFTQDSGYRLTGHGYDFGYKSSSANATLSFQNNESFDIILSGSSTSSAFSTAAPSSTTISAGGTIDITVTYTPVVDSSSLADMIVTDTYGRTFTLKLQGSNLEPPDHSTLSTDLALWLNSADIRALNTATNGANTYVSTWPDSSGRSEDLDGDASSSPTDRRPLYIDNGLNSQPVLRFDGSDDYMLVDPGIDKYIYYGEDETTLFVVFTQGTINNRYLLSGKYTATVDSMWPRCYLYYSGGGQFRVYGYNDWYISTSGAWLTSTSYLWTMEKDLLAADMLRVWVNTIMPGDSSNPEVFTVNGYNQHLAKLVLGANYNYTALFQGDLAEIIMYNRKLTAEETGWVNDYLNDKYNLW